VTNTAEFNPDDGRSTLLRSRGLRLAVLLMILLQLAPPPALADCGPPPCYLPCYCWTLVATTWWTTCGFQRWYEERECYCNTYPFGYFLCTGCFCYA